MLVGSEQPAKAVKAFPGTMIDPCSKALRFILCVNICRQHIRLTYFQDQDQLFFMVLGSTLGIRCAAYYYTQ
jgi:hypothetical protein